ncbi:MAG TPA: class I SAM-dependent methyltransferase [Rhodocyclaceae bacterium]|nr:class I SAM-dependent methyltransferase [Rhodocyclaceae bacterium]
MNAFPQMKISDPAADLFCDEREIYEALLPFDGATVLELGCGRAEKTRTIAKAGRVAAITAIEVDRLQHAENLRIADLPQVSFAFGGAEDIPAKDASFDIVLMFKSLHHVPTDKMDQALAEIRRVLKPGGLAYLSEPVFAGDFNEIVRLFHDERAVREAAFASIVRSVSAGVLEFVTEKFFDTSNHFDSFEQFEARVLKVTHSDHRLSTELYDTVRSKFMAHLGPQGARFRQPIRVDLLRRPR